MLSRFPSRLLPALTIAGIVLAFPTAAQISDIEAPQLVSFTFSPASVDVTSAAATVTIDATVTDNLSGLNYAYLYAYSPSQAQSAYCYLTRTSGTALSGAYQCKMTINPGAESGSWKIDNFYAYDMAGNYRNLTGASLDPIQPARTITVTATPDTTKPLLKALRITPASVDVSSGDQVLTIEIDIEDDIAGITPSATYTFSPVLTSPSGQQSIRGSGNRWTMLAGGTPLNATWRMQVVVPKDSEAGQWSVQSITQYDRLSRRWMWSTANITGAGLNPYFSVISASPDLSKPTVVDVTVSPGFVNTTLASQQVTVGVKATDTGTGVNFDPTSVSISWIYGPFLGSPSGSQSGYVSTFAGASAYKLVSGTVANGIWQGSFTLPRYAEAGTWKISSMKLKDRVNNELNLTRDQLDTMGLQRTIVVTQPTGAADQTINAATGGTVVDDVFGTKAQVSAGPNVLPANTQVSIDVFQSPLSSPTPVGFQAPGTRFVNISMIPHPAGLLPAPGLTITIPVAGNLTPGTVLSLYRIDTATGNLVAARSVTGGNVTGTVDPGGETATFTGIAALSTIVGLVPSGTLVGDANLDGVVSCLDYQTIKLAFGKRRGQAGYLASADLNNDGLISVNDLMVVARLLPAGCAGY